MCNDWRYMIVYIHRSVQNFALVKCTGGCTNRYTIIPGYCLTVPLNNVSRKSKLLKRRSLSSFPSLFTTTYMYSSFGLRAINFGYFLDLSNEDGMDRVNYSPR